MIFKTRIGAFVTITLCLVTLNNVLSSEAILVNSIPKSGTHLIMKCIELLTQKECIWIGDAIRETYYNHKFLNSLTGADIREIEYSFNSLSDEVFLYSHMRYSDNFNSVITNRNYKVFFIYRDPRAQAVSWARWQISHNKNRGLDIDQALMSIIQDKRMYEGDWKNINGIRDLYEAYLPWRVNPKIFAIRFEDLVGPCGGGDFEKQFKTVEDIAKYLELDLTKESLNDICLELFGGTVTFNDGQIDGWKKYFKKDHVDAFKKNAGQLLIDLGYEVDLNWDTQSSTSTTSLSCDVDCLK